MSVRRPAVAGAFYPADSDKLLEVLQWSFRHPLGPGNLPPSSHSDPVLALIAPHAGYVYSGPVAAHAYYLASNLDFDLVVIVGPNHYGVGSGVSAYAKGEWETPLGRVRVDDDAAKKLVEFTGIVDFDESAHRYEHSIEVHLPFLQYVSKADFKILPISMLMQDEETAVELGRGIAQLARDRGALIIASTDLTHYEPHEAASKKDEEQLKAILSLDVKEHYRVLRRLNVTMCGYGPAASVIEASKLLGAKRTKLLKYATSGQTGGDYSSVVGYGAAAFYEV